MEWIIGICWSIFGATAALQYIQPLAQIKGVKKFIALTILMIGGPIFAVAQILEVFLDCVMPDGWGEM